MKMSIIFEGFDRMAAIIDKTGKELKPAVDEALTETQKYIQTELEQAAAPYQSPKGGRKGWAKGYMYDAIIKNPKIEWEGLVGTVKVGFSSENRLGFMHSLFVMYGVPRHGKFNKGYSKDSKIYNAIRGTHTKKQIKKIQEETFKNYFKRQEGLL